MKSRILTLFIIYFILISHPVHTMALNNKLENKDYIILIDVNERTLSLLDKDTKNLIKKYPVAIGKQVTPSPLGQWRITSKALKAGPFGGYWLGLNAPWDTFGIHGTSNPGSIGSMASNGCIRMYNNNIEELFYAVNYDTQVIITGGANWLFSPYIRDINPNDKGADVYAVQIALKNLGYYRGVIDGIYGYPLELSVKKFRDENNIPGDSKIDMKFLNAIGIYKFE